MSEQPKALRLAEYWQARAKDLQTWVDENDYVEFGYRPEGLKREQADQQRTAAELRRLHVVNQELLEALKQCDEAMTWELGGEPIDTLMITARKAARAAIAKAEGETK